MTPVAESPAKADPAVQEQLGRNPWLWIPSLYFSQGIPYVIVMTMSVIMYRRLGISNTDIALYTSWLYLPWVIKPLWSPLVDITRTKRFWVVAMQFLISAGLGAVAFSIRGSDFFKWSLLLFGIMAFASATHDIAADGFYMLSLSKHDQAWWVGLRSTFYRTAMIVGSGLLVVLAGVLESRNGLAPVAVRVSAVQREPLTPALSPSDGERGKSSPILGAASANASLAVAGGDAGAPRLIVEPQSVDIPIEAQNAPSSSETISQARKWNREHGFLQELIVSTKQARQSWWTENVGNRLSKLIFTPLGRAWSGAVAEPLAHFLSSNFGEHTKADANAISANPQAARVGVIRISLSKPPADGRQLVVRLERKRRGIEYLGLAKGDKGFRLVEGERLVFTEANWNQPAMAVIELDPKLKREAVVDFLATSGNIPVAWSVTLFVVAGLFLAFSIWHSLILPRPVNDGPVVSRTRQQETLTPTLSTDQGRTNGPLSPALSPSEGERESIHRGNPSPSDATARQRGESDGERGKSGSFAGEFFSTLGSFFQKPGVLLALAFILFYRFDEAQLGKVISPFLLDSREKGGLGLTTSQVGLAYGTFGILALTCGGLLGGFTAARYGLKRMLPIMVCSMYLPKLAFVVLSHIQPENFLAICGAIAVEQLGYGFGFTAFMLYMLYFADGPHKTAHYAICTGFMALGMMVPGMWSGWVADLVGYKHFFVWVICSALPGFGLAMLLKIDPQFGKKAS